MKKLISLIILDGYGVAKENPGNAISLAKTPVMDKLLQIYPHTAVSASGESVGLPDGQMGNSEVGHTNIGAGRIVYQELTRITKSIKDGDFFTNKALLDAIENCKKNDSTLHLMGLLSCGGVHSHNTHLYGLLELAKKSGLKKVCVHSFLDGRDVGPTTGIDFAKELSAKLTEIGVGKAATVMGRYYAMDRDNRWERVEKAYLAMTQGVGDSASTIEEAIENSYKNNVVDEFVIPTVIDGGERITAKDSLVFFNFRPDRAREITRTFVDDNFNGFERLNGAIKPYFVCMTQYDETMPNVNVAFKPTSLKNTFGEYISEKGLKQLRIAETEKYAHVTFFFNGGVEENYIGEDRALISSPKVATYDLKPEMSAFEVADEFVKRVESDKYDVIILNFANCDMVGHTGNIKASIAAVETVDVCLGKVLNAVISHNGIALVTADHGNAEQMLDDNGNVQTAHSTNIVPFIITKEDITLKDGGCLADIAPTMLDLLGLDKPSEMTGNSLIK